MNYQNEIISHTCNLIRIPSTKKAALGNMPFGPDIDEALDYYLNLANDLGFLTYKDPRGYYGLVEYASQDEPIAILGHLDVVNGGDKSNWTVTSPFEPIVVDDVLYGRGAEDMKLAMVTVLYSIKALIDENTEFKRGIRIIVGTDEENEFRCMKNYAKDFTFPRIGFTPDGSFPVVNVETSLVELEFTSENRYPFKLTGGADFNTVADLATYQAYDAKGFSNYLTKLEVEHTFNDNKVVIAGTSVHVSDIERGESAINLMCVHLYNYGIHASVIDLVAQKFKLETNAKSFLGHVSDQFTGDLVCNFGLIEINDGKEYLGIDLRIPVMYDQEIIINRFTHLAKEYNLSNNIYFNDRKVYVDEASEIVKLALATYSEVCKSDAKCIHSRGGSYSKVADNYVGIGMNFPALGQVSTAHQSDEHYDLSFLPQAIEIYIRLIKKLCQC